jgi:hypothetical protein
MPSMRPRAHYGREAGLPGSDQETQEISMLAPHLLQSALVLVNTRLVNRVLGALRWTQQLTDTDLRGLTQLFWSNVAAARHVRAGPGQAPEPRAGRGPAHAPRPLPRLCPSVW